MNISKSSMSKLTVITFGTKNFIDKYSKPLAEDCKRFGYALHVGVIPSQKHISHINCTILKHIIEYIKTTDNRICILDPECRIVKPIPQEWIDADKPVLFQKSHYVGQTYEYDKELPSTYIGQPLLCSKEDLYWLDWWYQAVVSMKQQDVYPPNETMLVMSLKFNNVKYITKTICYNREYTGSYECVKGSWNDSSIVFKHPCIHSALDKTILAANDHTRENMFLSKRDLHNHFNDYKTIKHIDELMFKEITDIRQWPTQTVHKEKWYMIDDWLFDPTTGKLKHNFFDSIKYHHSVQRKLDMKIKTPVTNNFNNH